MSDSSSAWKVFATCQITTASISLVASTTIATMIVKATKKSGKLTLYSSPYHRIIFGLCISDMLSSFGMLTGPFAPPAHLEQARWSIGNDTTCKINGFFVNFGAGCVPFYTCALCYYCFCKIRKNMSDDAFAYKIEWKLHAAIITYNIGTTIASFITNAVHSSPIGSLCTYAAVPTGCRHNPDLYGECDKGTATYSVMLLLLWMFGTSFCCLAGIVVSMAMIYWHVVITRNRVFHGSSARFGRPQTVEKRVVEEESQIEHPHRETNGDAANDETNDAANDETNHAENLVKAYKREFMVQGCLYIAAFCITYSPVWAVFIVSIFGEARPSNSLLICFGIFYPLGGFFNILVFTRPKVQSLRRRNPEYSWIRGFILVLMAGGIVPSPLSQEPADESPDDLNPNEIVSNAGEKSINDLSFSNEISSLGVLSLNSCITSSGRFALSSGYSSNPSAEPSDSNLEPKDPEPPYGGRKFYSGSMRKFRTPLTPEEMSSSSEGSPLSNVLFAGIDTIMEASEEEE